MESFMFWLGAEGEPTEPEGAVVIDWTDPDLQIDE